MADEARALAKTLAFTAHLVMESDAADRGRICAAYDAGLQRIAEIIVPGASPRPGIEACIIEHERLKAAEDVGCAGWMLAAIATRIGERDLPKWQEAKKVIDSVVQLLGRYREARIH
ncbi:hypothetical protein IG197_32065 (plasmid) [Aminobacter sp. SR38]|jgi:hypothetical protein|uniref:hypothetical protein n=1 Tax=Aminobacter sp. SR38 TaxID=2774562 RepID=UPI00177FC867|nr:hypothetical protein [Aminobacter sp. SR38]QOF75218.1 hypothetical protein IG197_32065 [Aminobacter sp. SR38]